MDTSQLLSYDPHVHYDLRCPHCDAAAELCGYLSIVRFTVGHVARMLCPHSTQLHITCRLPDQASLN